MLDPLRVLRQHQGAPRLLDRAVRRARADGRPGGAHPRPPRRDARRGRRSRALRAGPATMSSILNDPFTGGTHLPDITLVSRTALGFAASRAHHADVGGREPGSMPADSRTLDEEGVVIPPTRIDDATVERARRADAQPGRAPRRPSRAARGAAARRRGGSTSCATRTRARRASPRRWTSCYAYSERLVRAGIAALPDGRYEAADVLEATEGELEIQVARHDRGRGDRRSTSRAPRPQHDGNLNCPLAVTRSACYFVVRCLTRPDVPASGGAFAPVTVRAPRGLARQRARRPPRSPAATSRRRAASSTSSSPRSARRSASRPRARGR